MPEPGNPQSLNRYAFVLNNPVKFTDPTGHSVCLDADCSVLEHPVTHRLMGSRSAGSAQAVAEGILEILGNVNDLEAMATISDIAAGYYPDWEEYLSQMGQIFIGTESTGTFALISAMMAGSCGGIGRESHDCAGNTVYFLDKGFHKDFQDRHNQPYHTWGYIAQTAIPQGHQGDWNRTIEIAVLANVFHDIVQSLVNYDDGIGTSWQDYVLSESAMSIGHDITFGLIVSPSEVGNVLRRELSPQGPGSRGRLQYLESTYGPLRGSP